MTVSAEGVCERCQRTGKTGPLCELPSEAPRNDGAELTPLMRSGSCHVEQVCFLLTYGCASRRSCIQDERRVCEDMFDMITPEIPICPARQDGGSWGPAKPSQSRPPRQLS